MIQLRTSLPYYGFLESRQGGRPENQDWMGFCDTWLGLLVVVCDGMGGGPGGKTASTVATQTIIDSVVASKGTDVSKKEALSNALEASNRKLLDMQQSNPSLRGMGTTVTALLINDMSATIVHMGDSRIYQLRFGHIQFRTTDHSQVMEMVTAGSYTEEDARNAPNSNIITRALGVTEDIEPEFSELPYEKGDRFVLCTDGIWNSMPEKELIPLMAKTSTPNGAVEKTMIAVNEIGVSSNPYHDNFTMALIETKRNSILKEKMTRKTRNLICVLLAAVVTLLLLVLIMFVSGKSRAIRVKELTEANKSLESRYMTEKAEWQSKEEVYKQNLNEFSETAMRFSRQIEEQKEQQEQALALAQKLTQTVATKVVSAQEEVKKIEESSVKDPVEILIDGIIRLFEAARDLAENQNIEGGNIQEMKSQINDLKEKLSDKDSKKVCKEVIDKLSQPVAREGKYANEENQQKRQGHYQALIQEMEKIRNLYKGGKQ